ncbi:MULTISPECIES: TRAP transporter small permease [unclassified Simplicispira]|jgi:C4-dicarboxylate transporter DctQ subunit|uniref:TRAP transporter small permease n=1 Tax=unclassified Simplicispira TaxID=2630407 RepID=UPI000D5CAE2C|nr:MULTISPECIES: TRAP transporter small permease [unclassified Simplicispira]MBH1978538.1 TRAP transporter small permease [Comamonadaceae bacterium]PVY57721.1 C4-dicarboxylate transporter DctQ subunit [Simplicispira sp. 125]REG18665.1 C4-dicarboxylate transporter DctQ subunit [Simplicispira sp. 110]HQY39880.1 TRAP transporter small permease [Giesbergeria sp.]
MKILNSLEEWIISLMLLAMTGLTFLQVVMRYVFNSGFTWALELTTVFFAIMIFVGVSYGVRVGSHIGVDALVKLLSPAKRKFFGVLAVVLSLVYVGFVLVGSMEYVLKMKDVGIELEDMSIERWQILAVMPLGMALTGFRFLQIFYDLITGRADSLRLADEAAEAMGLKATEDNE